MRDGSPAAETAETARLREAWRRHGWRAARLDPLGLRAPDQRHPVPPGALSSRKLLFEPTRSS